MSQGPAPFQSYAGAVRQHARKRIRPSTLEELVQAVRTHDVLKDGSITLRATGHSLHTQALGRDTVFSLDDLPHSIVITEADTVLSREDAGALQRHTVQVTGWTPWECVVRATLGLAAPARWSRAGNGAWLTPYTPADDRLDLRENRAAVRRLSEGALPLLVPYTFVSSGRITPAGSLSGDGVWRFSAALGRELESVVWLDLLTSTGELRRVHNPRWRSDSPHDDNDDCFHAVVGGFGLLGIVVRLKYLLLELDTKLSWSMIPDLDGKLPSGADAGRKRGRQARVLASLLRSMRDRAQAKQSLADAVLRKTTRPVWPDYPHCEAEMLGRVGQDLPVRALTWMREARNVGEAADFLSLHWHAQQRQKEEDGALPQRSSALTHGHFALLFPNHRAKPRVLLAQVAYGSADTALRPFRLWDRSYSFKTTARILRYRLLPWAARIGEQVAYRSVFGECVEHGPCANPIPEFGFFLEGHAVALSARREPSRTLQQAWCIPFEVDERGCCRRGRAELIAFVESLRQLSQRPCWQRNALRIQSCDIKVAPRSPALLSSSPDGPCFMVTATIENVAGYGRLWSGSPEAGLRELTHRLGALGGRIHLTKALHVEPTDLSAMYGDAVRRFSEVRRTVDVRGVWSSELARTLSL